MGVEREIVLREVKMKGKELTCQGGAVAEIINPVVRFLLKQTTIPYDWKNKNEVAVFKEKIDAESSLWWFQLSTRTQHFVKETDMKADKIWRHNYQR